MILVMQKRVSIEVLQNKFKKTKTCDQQFFSQNCQLFPFSKFTFKMTNCVVLWPIETHLQPQPLISFWSFGCSASFMVWGKTSGNPRLNLRLNLFLLCRRSSQQQSFSQDPTTGQHAEETQTAAAEGVLRRWLWGASGG